MLTLIVVTSMEPKNVYKDMFNNMVSVIDHCNTLPTKVAPPNPSVGASTRTHSTLFTLSSSLCVKGLT
jgi:hypothetical protein